jgi:hypothetical protein
MGAGNSCPAGSPQKEGFNMIKGHCECASVRYRVEGEIEDFSHCHCSQCRRLHGAAFATFAGVSRDRFRYLCGEDRITIYASSDHNDRVFCSVCGSSILVDAKLEPEYLYICMSTVEGDPARPRGYHAYVGSKAPWHEINDDLDQFEADTPE